MGTRNLTMVISDGQIKIAQYGQFDGYPGGQGSTVLKFLKTCDLNLFKERVNKLSFYTDDELKQVDSTLSELEDNEFEKLFPELNRDWAAKILYGIYYGEVETEETNFKTSKKTKRITKFGKTKLQDSSDFAADSLFCEWAYLIDLDKNTFEVYRGFVQEPLTENDRFYYLQDQIRDREDKYYPVKLLKEYLLTDLPNEIEFLQLEKYDDEEEEIEEDKN